MQCMICVIVKAGLSDTLGEKKNKGNRVHSK